jgi:hypothetical protein
VVKKTKKKKKKKKKKRVGSRYVRWRKRREGEGEETSHKLCFLGSLFDHEDSKFLPGYTA